MNNFWTIVSHTASGRLKAKSFLISTIVIMLLIIGITNISTIIDLFSSDDSSQDMDHIAVVDETEDASGIAEMLAAPNDEGPYRFQLIEEPVEQVIEEAREGEYEGVLQLSGTAETLTAELYGGDSAFAMGVEQEVQRIKEGVLTSELDIDQEQLAVVFQPVTFEQSALGEGESVETEAMEMRSYFTVLGVSYVLFFIIITYSSMIATEVATEKSSRVMELIVSSVNPVVQMFGKLVGIGLVGVINILSIVVALIIGVTIGGNNILDYLSGDFIDLSLIGYALLVLLLGYFLFGGVAAMLGALVSRTEDVQQAVQPLIYLAMIGFFLVTFGLNNSDAAFMTVASYIPFFTPQLLIMRIGTGVIAGWEIALLIAILLVSVLLVNYLAARVYKGGVLMYGKLSYKEGIKQALALSKKEK